MTTINSINNLNTNRNMVKQENQASSQGEGLDFLTVLKQVRQVIKGQQAMAGKPDEISQAAAEEPDENVQAAAAKADESAVVLTAQSSKAQTMDDIFEEAAQTYGISCKLLKAVAKAESGFNPRATSPKGAAGIMQLMPATARGLGVTDPYDVRQNIFGGAKYLKEQLDEFDGNVSLALAAYNAGAGNVRKYGGIPPFKETQNYVKKIMGYLGDDMTAGTAQSSKPRSVQSGISSRTAAENTSNSRILRSGSTLRAAQSGPGVSGLKQAGAVSAGLLAISQASGETGSLIFRTGTGDEFTLAQDVNLLNLFGGLGGMNLTKDESMYMLELMRLRLQMRSAGLWSSQDEEQTLGLL